MRTRIVLAQLTIWSGRLLAVGFSLLWGAFFLEHLKWFAEPGIGLPPAKVWLLQLAHLVMLIGLLVLLRWELLGGVITVLASLVFFGFVAGKHFPVFFGMTVLPVVLVLAARLIQPTAAPQSTP